MSAAIGSIQPERYAQESPYLAALAHSLEGVVYDADDGFVQIKSTVVSDRGRGAAESWMGADLAITAHIEQGGAMIDKAILLQGKLGGMEELSSKERTELVHQIENMKKYTRSPKIIFVRSHDGLRLPKVVSGSRVLEGRSPREYDLAQYFVARIMTTLDGDTRPRFVDAVQHSSMLQLRLLAKSVRRGTP